MVSYKAVILLYLLSYNFGFCPLVECCVSAIGLNFFLLLSIVLLCSSNTSNTCDWVKLHAWISLNLYIISWFTDNHTTTITNEYHTLKIDVWSRNLQFSYRYNPKCAIDMTQALIEIMACCRIGTNPLSQLMMSWFLGASMRHLAPKILPHNAYLPEVTSAPENKTLC